MSTDYTPTPISKEFGAALATAQNEMDPVQRNASNPAFKRGGKDMRYSDISAILEAVKPPLNKAGISLTMPALNREDGCVGAYLELRFESEVIVVPPFWIKPASGIPHAMVSALTYARRAAVTSYFSIPQEDDDGNTASDQGNSDRNEYAPPAGRSQRTTRPTAADDTVRAAAEKEAAERKAQHEQQAQQGQTEEDPITVRRRRALLTFKEHFTPESIMKVLPPSSVQMNGEKIHLGKTFGSMSEAELEKVEIFMASPDAPVREPAPTDAELVAAAQEHVKEAATV